MQVITDKALCKKLWEEYSPKQTIWDETEIIFGLLSDSKKPHFLLFEHGLLPLWYDEPYKTYYFFGGEYPEARKLWFDKNKLQEVYDAAPIPTKLFDIDEEILNGNGFDLQKDYTYFLPLKNIENTDDFFSRFSKKHKHNLKYDLKKIMSENIQIEWKKEVDFDLFVKYNVERFGSESDMHDVEFQKEMKLLLKTLEDKIICVYLKKEEKTIGLEFCVKFKDTFHVINGGYDKSIKNLGKLLIFECIKKGIELKAKEIDFMTGNSGWKELWNLDKKELISLIKK